MDAVSAPEAEKATGFHLEKYKWQPGLSGNPRGKPVGSRTKLGEAFLEAMHSDFQQHGVEAIERVRIEKPDQYLKVIASILPKELKVTTEVDLPDDELDRRIHQLASLANLYLGTEAGIAGAAGGTATKAITN